MSTPDSEPSSRGALLPRRSPTAAAPARPAPASRPPPAVFPGRSDGFEASASGLFSRLGTLGAAAKSRPKAPRTSGEEAVTWVDGLLAFVQARKPVSARSGFAGALEALARRGEDREFQRRFIERLCTSGLLERFGEVAFPGGGEQATGERERAAFLSALNKARIGRAVPEAELRRLAGISRAWQAIGRRLTPALRGLMPQAEHDAALSALRAAKAPADLARVLLGIPLDAVLTRPALGRLVYQGHQRLAADGQAELPGRLAAVLRDDPELSAAYAAAVGLPATALILRLTPAPPTARRAA